MVGSPLLLGTEGNSGKGSLHWDADTDDKMNSAADRLSGKTATLVGILT